MLFRNHLVKITFFLTLVLINFTFNAKAPMYYQLVQKIQFTDLTATKVYSSDRLYLCSGQNLHIYNLLTGQLLNSVNFTSISAGSTLTCFDAYENNTFCLMNKGTVIIRYNIQTKNYDIKDNALTKTGGKLLLGGRFSVTNSPVTAQVYIFDHQTSVGFIDKPLVTATTADYFLEVNAYGTQLAAFQSRRLYIYRYSSILNTWSKVFSLAITPPTGTTIYWLTFSPLGDVFYNAKGISTIQKRNATDYTLISERNYTGLTVSNVQFTNKYALQLSIHLYNSTANSSFVQLFNITSGQSTYKYPATSISSFQLMKVYPDTRTMILYYSTFGIEVYKLVCPSDSIFSEAAGICLYCNETDDCTPSFSALQEQVMQISGRFYSFPTIRQSLKSCSYLFLSIDSLWMYQYHNRTYGNNIKDIFQSVRKIEDMKFAFFSIIQTAADLLTYTQYSIENISMYFNYTNSQYRAAENTDGSFLSNSLDFLVFHIPGTLMTFLIFRWIFFKAFNYKISSFFRLYGFWGYFLVCLLQPNVQYFSFLLGNEFYLSFYFDYFDKIFGILWINCLFLILFFSVTLTLFLKYLYEKQVKFFMQNTFRVGWGFSWIIFSLTLKRIFTGLTHSYLYYYPTAQLICLILAQLFQLCFMFFLWKKFSLFKQQLGVAARIFINLIMMTFQLTLLLTGFIDDDRTIKNFMDWNMYLVIMCLFGNSLVFCVLTILSSIIQSIRHKKQPEENEEKSAKTSRSYQFKTPDASPIQDESRNQTPKKLPLKKPTLKSIRSIGSKPKFSSIPKSKVKIESNVIIQRQGQDDDRKSTIQMKKQCSAFSLVESQADVAQVSPGQLSGKQSLISLKVFSMRKPKKAKTVATPTDNPKSNISINQRTCVDLDVQKHNKIFSSKKIKSSNAVFNADFKNKKSLKNIISRKQIQDDIIFSPPVQIKAQYKSIKDIIVEQDNTKHINN